MIFCPNCLSAAFDDMDTCYVCMSPLKSGADSLLPELDFDIDLSFLDFDPIIEEPKPNLQYR